MKQLNFKASRPGGQATEEEVRLLSRGKKNKRVLAHIEKQHKAKKARKGTDEELLGITKRKKINWQKRRHEKIGENI
jgi:hypothetical protein